MEKSVQMILVGYHHFNSKDKTKTYYQAQCLHNIRNETNTNCKATLINIFVDEETYRKIINMNVGENINVVIIPNLETGKVSYKINL